MKLSFRDVVGHDEILMSPAIGRWRAKLAPKCRDLPLQHCAFEHVVMLAGDLHPA
jgi:hypothetical protein